MRFIAKAEDRKWQYNYQILNARDAGVLQVSGLYTCQWIKGEELCELTALSKNINQEHQYKWTL